MFTLIAHMFGKQIIHTLSVQTASCRFTDVHVCVLGVNAAHFLKLRRLASVSCMARGVTAGRSFGKRKAALIETFRTICIVFTPSDMEANLNSCTESCCDEAAVLPW